MIAAIAAPLLKEFGAAQGIQIWKDHRQRNERPCITHHLTVVTRNAPDLERCQAKVFNPWKD
jgi:hypothetical protein